MGRYRMQVEPGKDLYCLWTTISDGPIFWGTKAELREFEIEDAIRRAQQEVERVFDRDIARADKYGSDSYASNGLWGDEMTLQAAGGFWRIPRERLGELLATYDEETQKFDLTGFEKIVYDD